MTVMETHTGFFGVVFGVIMTLAFFGLKLQNMSTERLWEGMVAYFSSSSSSSDSADAA